MNQSNTVLQKVVDLIHVTTEYRTDDVVVAIELCACACLVLSKVGRRGYWSRDFLLIGCDGVSMLLLVKQHGYSWEV
jgi:hypothetical protein